MSALPIGTVTFVFSDIEGSTTLLKSLGDRYGEVLDAHRKLMREAFTSREGVEIDTQGDAFFFAFPRARDAVLAAVEAQRQHESYDWPDGNAVRVRMGLHTGEPAVGSEGYLGIDVVRAARLCTVGRGGQVVMSETTRALIGSTLPPGVAIHTLGERRLKDIDEPERIFELDIDGVSTSEPATKESAPGPTGLPDVPPAPTPPGPAPEPPDKPDKRKRESWDDFGERLSQQIQDRVRTKIEDRMRRKLEEPLERMLSEVDALAERATEHPERITKKLDEN